MKKVLRGVWLVLLIVFVCLPVASAAEETEASELPVVLVGQVTEPDSFWPDKNLEKTFQKYWLDRSMGLWKKTFELEAPHFQEMAKTGRYRIYIQNSIKNDYEKIELIELEKQTEHLVSIRGTIYMTVLGGDDIQKIGILDHWVTIDGKWYHVVKDRILFPETM